MENTIKTSLYDALFNFQNEVPAVTKDGEASSGKWGYKYATYEKVRETIADSLKKNNLLVIHQVNIISSSMMERDATQTQGISIPALFVVTTIYHTLSKETIANSVPVVIKREYKDDPQAMGKSITYAKRYGLVVLLGLSVEDEDTDALHEVQTPKMSSHAFNNCLTLLRSNDREEKRESARQLLQAQNDNQLTPLQISQFKKVFEEEKQKSKKEVPTTSPMVETNNKKMMTYEDLQKPNEDDYAST